MKKINSESLVAIIGIGEYGASIVNYISSNNEFNENATTIVVDCYDVTLSGSTANKTFLVDKNLFFDFSYIYEECLSENARTKNMLSSLSGVFYDQLHHFDVIFLFSETRGYNPSELTKAFSFWLKQSECNSFVIPIIHDLHQRDTLGKTYCHLDLISHLNIFTDLVVTTSIKNAPFSLSRLQEALEFFLYNLRQTPIVPFYTENLFYRNSTKSMMAIFDSISYEPYKGSNEELRSIEKKTLLTIINQFERKWLNFNSPYINHLNSGHMFFEILIPNTNLNGFYYLDGLIKNIFSDRQRSLNVACRINDKNILEIRLLAIREKLRPGEYFPDEYD